MAARSGAGGLPAGFSPPSSAAGVGRVVRGVGALAGRELEPGVALIAVQRQQRQSAGLGDLILVGGGRRIVPFGGGAGGREHQHRQDDDDRRRPHHPRLVRPRGSHHVEARRALGLLGRLYVRGGAVDEIEPPGEDQVRGLQGLIGARVPAGLLVEVPDVAHGRDRIVEEVEGVRVRDPLEVVEAAEDRLEMRVDPGGPVLAVLAVGDVGLLGAPQLGEGELERPAEVGEDPRAALLVGEGGDREADLIAREAQRRECYDDYDGTNPAAPHSWAATIPSSAGVPSAGRRPTPSSAPR